MKKLRIILSAAAFACAIAGAIGANGHKSAASQGYARPLGSGICTQGNLDANCETFFSGLQCRVYIGSSDYAAFSAGCAVPMRRP